MRSILNTQPAHSSGRRNSCVRRVRRSRQLVKGLGRCSPAKGLSRPSVEGDRHGREVVGAACAQVGALRKVLAQQPVGVLIRAALPRAVGIAEVDLKTGIDPQAGVLAHLRPLIPGQRLPQLLGQGGDRARDGGLSQSFGVYPTLSMQGAWVPPNRRWRMILNALVEKLKRRAKDDFKDRHFEATLILRAVSWYLRYPLSYRDIEELFLERGLAVDHSTLNRWVLAYAPLIERRLRTFRKPHCGSIR